MIQQNQSNLLTWHALAALHAAWTFKFARFSLVGPHTEHWCLKSYYCHSLAQSGEGFCICSGLSGCFMDKMESNWMDMLGEAQQPMQQPLHWQAGPGRERGHELLGLCERLSAMFSKNQGWDFSNVSMLNVFASLFSDPVLPFVPLCGSQYVTVLAVNAVKQPFRFLESHDRPSGVGVVRWSKDGWL